MNRFLVEFLDYLAGGGRRRLAGWLAAEG
jgi:hypothetical protein